MTFVVCPQAFYRSLSLTALVHVFPLAIFQLTERLRDWICSTQFPSVVKGLAAKRNVSFLGCVVDVIVVRRRKVSISSTKKSVSRLRGDPIPKKNGR